MNKKNETASKMFGMKVWYSAEIVKHFSRQGGNNYITSHPAEQLEKIGTGIIIGVRYLPDGETVRYREDGSEFTRTGTTHCFLVVSDMFSNPVYVDPKSMRVMGKLGIPDLSDITIMDFVEKQNG